MGAFRNGRLDGKLLHRFFSRYAVIRTIPGKGDRRLAFVADLFNNELPASPNKQQIVDIIEAFTGAIVDNHSLKKRPLSAVSKAAWMKWRHPAAILDRFAVEGLNRLGLHAPQGDYATFHQAWMCFYDRLSTREEVSKACEWLVKSRYADALFNFKATTPEEVSGWLEAEWFHNRVVDQRLVVRGQWNDLIPAAMLARYMGRGEFD